MRHQQVSAHQLRLAAEFRARKFAFIQWLEDSGAVLQQVTNPYEVLRYRAYAKEGDRKRTSHVVYTRADETLSFTGYAEVHYNQFVAGQTFPIQRPPVRLKKDGTPAKRQYKETDTPKSQTLHQRVVPLLKERDGEDCCFCHKPLGFDVTVEHWLARHLGGTDDLENLRLAHRRCNADVGHKPVDEKEAYRQMRLNPPPSKVEHWT